MSVKLIDAVNAYDDETEFAIFVKSIGRQGLEIIADRIAKRYDVVAYWDDIVNGIVFDLKDDDEKAGLIQMK